MQKSRKPVILTIDDEECIRRSFKFYLEDLNYEVLEAENGKKAIEVINRKIPDLIIVDLRMPVMNGFEFIDYAKLNIPGIPLIVVSGTGNINDLDEAVRLGAVCYLLKPVTDLVQLKSIIEKNIMNK